MDKPTRISVFAAMALTVLATGLFPAGNPIKTQPTQGIVTLVFDDGWSSQYNNAFPLMQDHGFEGTYYIITSYIGTGSYMTMSQLHALQNAGNEIGSHSVDHPDFTSLTDAQINYECSASQQLLQANGFPAVDFAYPYGDSNSHVDSIVLTYYRSARYSYASGYLMPIPPDPIHMSIPMGFPGETGASSALAQDENIVAQAQSTNSWVIIFFHNIITTPLTTAYEIEQSDFAALLNYIGNSSVQVLTVNQALNLLSAPQRVTALPSSLPYSMWPYSSLTIDVGQNQVFSSSVWGGTSPYNYQWYLNGYAVGGDSDSYTFAPSSAGSFSLSVCSIDSNGAQVTSNTESITVNSALVPPTASASTNAIDQGQTSTLTSSTIFTGTPPYSYQWFQEPPGGSYSPISGATSSSYSFDTSNSTTAGHWLFELQVTDAVSEEVTSNSVSIKVNTTPIVNISPASWTMDIWQVETFSATASSGSGSYAHYQWYIDSKLQADQTTSTFTYSPTLPGVHYVTVTVADSLGATSSQSSPSLVTVNPALTPPLCSTSVNMVDQGQSSNLTISGLSGGTAPYSYQWLEKGPSDHDYSPTSGANSPSYMFYTSTSTAIGAWSFELQVTDNASSTETVTSSSVYVTVNSALFAPMVSVSPSIVNQGQTCTLTSASATTGSAPYTYRWLEFAPNGSHAEVNSSSAILSFFISEATATGTWHFILELRDNVGAEVNSSAVSVTVNPVITASAGPGGSISPSGNVAVNYGGNQGFTIIANAGYNIADVEVNGSSVGPHSHYDFNDVQDSNTISVTFALAPNPTPSPAPTTTPKSTSTSLPMTIPTPTMSPSPTLARTSSSPTSALPSNRTTGSSKQSQSQSLHQEVTYGILAAVAVLLLIVPIGLLIIKSRKDKSSRNQRQPAYPSTDQLRKSISAFSQKWERSLIDFPSLEFIYSLIMDEA